MTDVIGAGKWQQEVQKHGLSLDLTEIPRKYREKNNMSAVRKMSVLTDKVREWEKNGHVEGLEEPAWCCNPMSVAAKYDPVNPFISITPSKPLISSGSLFTRL